MDLKLEVLVIPVTDVERAKRFYEKLGFRLDLDYTASEEYRAVHFTPPGLGGVDHLWQGRHYRTAWFDRPHTSRGRRHRGRPPRAHFARCRRQRSVPRRRRWTRRRLCRGHRKPRTGPDPQGRSYGSYASFSDPDGNVWLLQEIKERLPGRVTRQSLNGKTKDILLNALQSAAIAHGVHEKELGKHDPDWPQWYAQHMTHTLEGAKYDLTGPAA